VNNELVLKWKLLTGQYSALYWQGLMNVVGDPRTLCRSMSILSHCCNYLCIVLPSMKEFLFQRKVGFVGENINGNQTKTFFDHIEGKTHVFDLDKLDMTMHHAYSILTTFHKLRSHLPSILMLPSF